MNNGKEIINILIAFLGVSINELSAKCGYKRAQAFYDLQSGKTKQVSANMANAIVKAFPVIDKDWLLSGDGEMLKTEPPKIELQQVGDNVMISREVFDQIAKLTDAVMSQQKTIEAQQRITEAQQGNFTKLTETVTAQAEAISDLAKKGERVGGAKVAAG